MTDLEWAPSAEAFDGRTRLTFRDPQGQGRAVDYLTVQCTGPGMSVSRQVYAGWQEGFVVLGRYFDELASSWRGWDGTRVFESIEHDLRLSATHDGHVNLRVLLWESTEPLGWRLEAELRLDAGEQLTGLARDFAVLLGT